jgi:protein-disulfide isomerase
MSRAKSAKSAAVPAKQPESKSIAPFIIIGVVLIALVAVGVGTLRKSGSKPASTTPNSSSSASRQTPSGPPTRGTTLPGAQPAHVHGTQNAPVVLEEFGDYQCPPCAAMHPVLKAIEDDYGDRVALIFRNYPLQNMHKNAFSAARAAEAAAMQGKFWEMHDMIYKGQTEWAESAEPRPIFTNYARRLELNVDKFTVDMGKDETSTRIVADAQRGTALGVTGTPTIFLNGRMLPTETALDNKNLRAEIDAALKAKSQ